jgi:hypothetical protein
VIKAAALALLAGGILLTIFGVNAMNSTSSDVARFLTGAPTDRAIWMLVGGILMLVAGAAGLAPGFRKG